MAADGNERGRQGWVLTRCKEGRQGWVLTRRKEGGKDGCDMDYENE